MNIFISVECRHMSISEAQVAFWILNQNVWDKNLFYINFHKIRNWSFFEENFSTNSHKKFERNTGSKFEAH